VGLVGVWTGFLDGVDFVHDTIDEALLCKAETDGQLPCIDRWPMQAQGQIGSITVFIIQCLPGSGKPWKDFQDKRQSWIPLHELPTPPTFGTFADVEHDNIPRVSLGASTSATSL